MPGGEPAAGLGDHCQEVEAPCIRQWTEMSASERAHLWPYLDEVSRAMHWRSMSTRERSDMRREMSAADRDKLRKRFCSEQAGAVMSKETRKLRRDERQLLRQQITEFHVQLTGSGRTQGRPEIRSQQAKQGKTVVHPQGGRPFSCLRGAPEARWYNDRIHCGTPISCVRRPFRGLQKTTGRSCLHSFLLLIRRTSGAARPF